MNPVSLLVVLLGLATGPVDTQPSAKGQGEVAKATAAFNRGEYVEAARTFDRLHAERGGLALLHYAALAWAAAGDDTRAILRWRRFEADPQSRGLAEAQDAGDYLAEAYKRTTAVRVSLEPEAISGQVTTLSLTRLDKGEQAISIAVTEAAADERGRHIVFLAPGRWSLTASSALPGYTSAKIEVDVSAQQAEVETDLVFRPQMGEIALRIEGLAEGEEAVLVLQDEAGIEEPVNLPLPPTDGLAVVRAGAWTYEVTSPRGEQLKGRIDVSPSETTTLPLTFKVVGTQPEPPPPEETPRRRLRLDLGLGLGAVVAGGVGVGTSVAGYQVRGPRGLRNTGGSGCEEDEIDAGLRRECAIVGSSERSTAGASLMGSSLGLATNALLVRAKIRHQLYWVPWSSGLVFTAGGTIWLQRAHMGFVESSLRENGENDDDLTVEKTDIKSLYWRREVPASVLMGFGAGLLVGSSVVLLTQRIRGRSRAAGKSVSIVPGITGLSLEGKF